MARVTWEQCKAALIKANKQGATMLKIDNRFAINDFAAATLLIAEGCIEGGVLVEVDSQYSYLRYDITPKGKTYRHGGNIVFQPPPLTSNVITFEGPLTESMVDKIRKAWRDRHTGAQGYRNSHE